MLDSISDHWHFLIGTLTIILQVLVSVHVILYKRDSRAAIAWVCLILLVPLFGVFFYILFGINRIRRKGAVIRSSRVRFRAPQSVEGCTMEDLAHAVTPKNAHLTALSKLIGRIAERKLLPGNEFTILENGEETYPSMLQAIQEAKDSISLSTYIFSNDKIGKSFLDAFANAVKRGVLVRVLVDDIGARYSLPSIVHALQQQKIPVARFLPTHLPIPLTYLNLRNHRKILVVDGKIGYTGGINIEDDHLLKSGSGSPTQDLHFRIEGPVVAHLQETFMEDWAFATGESLDGEKWFPILKKKGETLSRGIKSGPDEDFELMRWTILGALDSAQSRVRIVTPYFVPDQSLITALNLCSLKGIEVDIILPEDNNLALVRWASVAQLWQVLEHGARVWLTPPPFDHSKLMVVDDAWVFVGSGNLDMRSLRLNFEFNVECYDVKLANRLNRVIDRKMKDAHWLTLQEVNTRSLPIKLRDGVARLFAPYL